MHESERPAVDGGPSCAPAGSLAPQSCGPHYLTVQKFKIEQKPGLTGYRRAQLDTRRFQSTAGPLIFFHNAVYFYQPALVPNRRQLAALEVDCRVSQSASTAEAALARQDGVFQSPRVGMPSLGYTASPAAWCFFVCFFRKCVNRGESHCFVSTGQTWSRNSVLSVELICLLAAGEAAG